MKKILVTILSMLYMLSATGATVHIHYCMGKMVHAGLIHDDEDKCGKCGMHKNAQKKGCCKDEHKTFKSADHQFTKASLEFAATTHTLPATPYPTFHFATVKPVSINESAQANAPPSLWRTCPIYIQVCNFRI